MYKKVGSCSVEEKSSKLIKTLKQIDRKKEETMHSPVKIHIGAIY